MRIGPETKLQLARLASQWEQGDHVLITGPTKSGKTELARLLDEIRLQAGGHVVVFVSKVQPDDTILKSYKGWTRWKTWKKHPKKTDKRILLWPAVEGKPMREVKPILRDVFQDALDAISVTGRWTTHIDEGLTVCSPHYLGLGETVGLMYTFMRTAKTSMITLAQRPSHLPLAIYPNIQHAFIGRSTEAADRKRLADMDGPGSKELERVIMGNALHDFTWVKLGREDPPEQMNIMR